MEDTFPFNVTYNQDALLDDFPWQLYHISAAFDIPELDTYKQLSDKYSQVDWRISFIDVTALIMEERAPELLDHVEFDEEGYLLDMYLDSDTALRTFIAVICPIFQQLPLLEEYMQRVANRKKY
jgi:hypothetical protein